MRKYFSLENKTIIVTGSAGMLGSEFVESIINFGGYPILIDVNKKNLQYQEKKIFKKYKKELMTFAIDISNEKQVQKSLEQIISKDIKIDGLINNAAINPQFERNNKKNFSRLENYNLKNWTKEIDVGLKGAFLCAKYFGSEISKNVKGGSIINISSDLGLIAPDQRLYISKKYSKKEQPVKPITYSIIKSGLIGLTKYLSTYWAENNVRCNAICPGGVENNQPDIFKKNIEKLIPMRRMARKDEFNSTIIYLLSDASAYVNGAVISIDGGRTAW